jgi:hypothetical protein
VSGEVTLPTVERVAAVRLTAVLSADGPWKVNVVRVEGVDPDGVAFEHVFPHHAWADPSEGVVLFRAGGVLPRDTPLAVVHLRELGLAQKRRQPREHPASCGPLGL